jgi:leucyl-tRNA synthetase
MAPPDRAGAPDGGGQPSSSEGRKFRRTIHESIQRVTHDLEHEFHFNTAVSAIMELVNALHAFEAASPDGVPAGERRALLREAVETVTRLLAPFCPHLTEEIWALLGHERSIFREPWPLADTAALARDDVTLVVQVDGKVRSRLVVEVGTARERIERLALDDDKVRPWVDARRIARVVVVPNRLVNIVTAA